MARHLATVMIALTGCGGGDGSVHHDAGNLDGAPIPPPPALGAQIDRMGRPLIGTALIGVFAAAQDQAAMRDAYNRASDPTAWATTLIATNQPIEIEIENNLAVFDAWDIGMNTTVSGAGCGNALRYLAPATQAGPTSSYRVAGDLFSDDEIYVDTSHTSCPFYLALEFELASAGKAPHTTCGGRMLSHDVVDMTYSVLAGGLDALDVASNNYAPKIHDGVGVHGDIKETVFPFLGPPHP